MGRRNAALRVLSGALIVGLGLVISALPIACGRVVTVDGSGGAGGAAPSDDSTAATSVSSIAASSSGAGQSAIELVGRPCGSDAECGIGGACIRATDDHPLLLGGAPNGYCTLACEEYSIDCGTSNRCLQAGGQGQCFLGCTRGPPPWGSLWDPLDEAKCHGRPDLRCRMLDSGDEVCWPTCNDDSQCEGGLGCDLERTVCTPSPGSGLPMGAACDQDGDCAGTCLQFTDAEITLCSTMCTLGGLTLDTKACGGLGEGLCIFAAGGSGFGDEAYCTPACTEHGHCQSPTFFCQAIPELTEKGIHHGFCFGGSAPCPGGAADCVLGGACTLTKHGPYCLDPQFALGAAGPG